MHRPAFRAQLVAVALVFAVVPAVVPITLSLRTGTAGGDASNAYLAAVDSAVNARDVSRAVMAWRDAYGTALGSRQWQPMLAVGQAALRIGQVAGTAGGFDAKARQCYLSALFRARQQGSLDGVLLVTEAFAQLGDCEVAAQGLRIADALADRARGDSHARERVAAFRERLACRSSLVGQSDLDPFPLLFADEMAGP